MRALLITLALLVAAPAHAGNVSSMERVSRAVTATLPPGLAVGQVRAPELPAGDLSIEWLSSGARPGWVNVLATVRAGGRPLGKGWARVELKPLRRVPVAARALAAGEVIVEGDVVLEERPVSPADSTRAATAGLPGARLTRNVPAGEVLVDSDVVRAAPLPYGTPVRVLVRRGAVSVTASGTLERPARPGEPAVVRVAAAQRPVTGRLLDATTFVPDGEAP
jgi:flagella basal body P-ring formation protein FlgA